MLLDRKFTIMFSSSSSLQYYCPPFLLNQLSSHTQRQLGGSSALRASNHWPSSLAEAVCDGLSAGNHWQCIEKLGPPGGGEEVLGSCISFTDAAEYSGPAPSILETEDKILGPPSLYQRLRIILGSPTQEDE